MSSLYIFYDVVTPSLYIKSGFNKYNAVMCFIKNIEVDLLMQYPYILMTWVCSSLSDMLVYEMDTIHPCLQILFSREC